MAFNFYKNSIVSKFLIGLLVVGFVSCATHKTRSRYQKPKRKKEKPCDCPSFNYSEAKTIQFIA